MTRRLFTAEQLATQLDDVRILSHSTAQLSYLDEATLPFREGSPEIAAAHKAFDAARVEHKRSYDRATDRHSDAAWQDAVTAAARLAEALRPLGDQLPPGTSR